MAILHQAELRPSKLEVVAALLASRDWAGPGGTASPERVGAYRFDDPADEVGVEVHLVRVGAGPVLQVPLTYRGARLEGADDALFGLMQHSVLGRRWAYDGCADPVAVACMATAALTGGTQAEQHVQTDHGLERREPDTLVAGSGDGPDAVAPPAALEAVDDGGSTLVRADGLELVVRRVVDDTPAPHGWATLTGTWPGSDVPRVLALARRTHA